MRLGCVIAEGEDCRETVEKLLEQGFKRVSNDMWLRRALRAYNNNKTRWIFYFNPETKQTVARRITLFMGQWWDTLWEVLKNGDGRTPSVVGGV